jgi:hypothetical protein
LINQNEHLNHSGESRMNFKSMFCAGTLALASFAAHADDWGCRVVLCLANPAGPTAVAECVPPIERLWSELAKGHGFPFCDMNTSGASGNSANHAWASGGYCPPQYTYYAEDGTLMCAFRGAVSINVNNKPYNRTWWNGRTTVTENYSTEARNTPGASTKFDQDYAAWKAQQDAAAAAAAAQNYGS